jgi:hypothetical protein
MANPIDPVTVVNPANFAGSPTTNEVPVDMYDKQFSAYPSLTPLTVILSKLSEKESIQPRFDWIERKEIPDTIQLGADATAVATSLTVVNNALTCPVGSQLYNAKRDEIALVSAAPSTDTGLTVTRAQGGTTGAAWKAGDIIHVGLPAVAENDTTSRNVTVANEANYNLICLTKIGFQATRTLLHTKRYGDQTWLDLFKSQKYYEFRRKKEKTLWFGGRGTSGSGATTVRMFNGIVRRLRSGTLYKDFGGVMTESGFRNYIGDYKNQNPDVMEIWVFLAGTALDIINNWGLDKVRLSPQSKELGMDVYTYISRGIRCNLVPMPLFDEDPHTAGWGFILDMQRIMLRTMERDTYYPWDRTPVGGELEEHIYRSQFSVMLANESYHSMFVNATL